MNIKHFLSAACAICMATGSMAQANVEWGKWETCGDQGNGIYMNPIIQSDYSDIDCIRVGEDYYAISSTFQFSPGMTILHSKDLVNWEICGHAITELNQISRELDYTRMNRYGRGVWAGTLRHHNGRFYLFFGTPDEGFFTTSALRPEGPWEPLTPLLREAGWDDCTAIWDEDGRAYFLGTHFKDGYKTYLFPMSADGKEINRDKAILLNEGSGREASKLIKHNNYYYLVFSEHKNGIGRYVMAKRAKKVTGPYKEEKQLALPSCEAKEPNQGGIIEGKDGRWYFLTHHGTGDWDGRIVSLLPVTWTDGWPIIGTVLPEGVGTMCWGGTIPAPAGTEKLSLRRSDDFDGEVLPPQWQWNYQPRDDFFSLSERPGWLRLKAFRPIENDNLMKAGNTLTQRVFRGKSNEVTVKIDLSNLADGQKAGLCHFSASHSALGVAKEGAVTTIEYRINGKTVKGEVITSSHLWLRSCWGMDGRSRYYYSTDNDIFKPFGDPYQLTWGHYRGDRIGIYCFNNLSEAGFIDIDYFHYELQ